jgi:hypothetical protein
MKAKLLLPFIVYSVLSLLACRSASGLLGSVRYGEGDCMPMIDTDRQRKFEIFSGDLYIFRKSWLDSVQVQDPEQLKKLQQPVSVKNGSLSLELPPGTYIVMPAGLYLYNEDNTVTIPAKGKVTKDFMFFKCLTY